MTTLVQIDRRFVDLLDSCASRFDYSMVHLSAFVRRFLRGTKVLIDLAKSRIQDKTAEATKAIAMDVFCLDFERDAEMIDCMERGENFVLIDLDPPNYDPYKELP